MIHIMNILEHFLVTKNNFKMLEYFCIVLISLSQKKKKKKTIITNVS